MIGRQFGREDNRNSKSVSDRRSFSVLQLFCDLKSEEAKKLHLAYLFLWIYSFGACTAVALNNVMWDENLCCKQIRVFDVVDHLGCRLNTELEGVDVHRCQLGRGQAREQGIVERDDREVIGDGQTDLKADAL